MAQTTFIESGVDRLQDTLRGWGRDIERTQKDLSKRRKRLEKDAERRFARLRKRVESNRYVKRAGDLRDDVRQQIDARVGELLESLPIATQADVKRLERRVSALTRRVRELEG